MKNLIKTLCIIGSITTVYADTAPVKYDLTVDSKLANKNAQLTVTSNYPGDIVINKISQFTNNGDACAVANDDYLIHSNKPLTLFPFTYKDMANCFSSVHLFERYSNGTHPTVLGFYDAQQLINFKVKDYLSDWGAYILTPVVFKIDYTFKNEVSQKAIVKYFVYKINE
ncbi:MAG: hypothetical protein K2Y14_01220 [Burkholderiales bacterium]|nr:hypothetical protein [Burkholderiales bacterium]